MGAILNLNKLRDLGVLTIIKHGAENACGICWDRYWRHFSKVLPLDPYPRGHCNRN